MDPHANVDHLLPECKEASHPNNVPLKAIYICRDEACLKKNGNKKDPFFC
jgi:hypothetical protein